MSTEAVVPTITNVGTVPITSRKLFVNIPVNDVQRSITFFEQLGFAFNRQFTDATATCMLVGADAYFMLMLKDRFATFSKRPVGKFGQETSALFAITVDSRDEVDALYEKALAAGATKAADPQDHGFMYVQSFHDLDGHHWELFWMDPSAING
ncbi:MAG: VOC family protein [Gemmatimonadaceae bacterium]